MGKNLRRNNSLLSLVREKKVNHHNYRRPQGKIKPGNWRRLWRYTYLRLLRLQGKPEAIARGWAVGIFAGCFPFFGLQIIIALILATLFRGNKIAAATGTWISNPLTYLPIFVFNFQIGQLIAGTNELSISDLNLKSWSALIEAGSHFAITLFIGCFFVGCILSSCTYFFSLRLMERMRHRRH